MTGPVRGRGSDARTRLAWTNRDALRQATRDIHTAAEHRWLPSGRFDHQDTYRDWLHGLWDTHNVHGRLAAEALPQFDFAIQEKTRRDALSRDIGRTIDPIRLGQGAISSGWAWGVLYALNGSALGASGLLKSGSIADQWPASYLMTMQAYVRSGALKTFFDVLNAQTDPLTDMIVGATAVFQSLTQSPWRRDG